MSTATQHTVTNKSVEPQVISNTKAEVAIAANHHETHYAITTMSLNDPLPDALIISAADSIVESATMKTATVVIATSRSLDNITSAILTCKNNLALSFIDMGRNLCEAQTHMPAKQSWQAYLRDNVKISIRDAQRFMRLAREFPQATTLSSLGYSRSYALLALPPAERELFLEKSHEVKGELKEVTAMSVREVGTAVQQYKMELKGEPSPSKDSTVKQKPKAELVSNRKDFHTNFQFVQSGIDGLLAYIRGQQSDPETYNDHCKALRDMCSRALNDLQSFAPDDVA
jgi:hypothetical protein